MKNHPSSRLRRDHTLRNSPMRRKEQAVALIIVLAMLVLLSGLIVSFMTTVSNERASSSVNSAIGSTRQIADSTLNLVMAQIREATSQSGNGASWASQPGAIRTFTGRLGTTAMNLPKGAYAFPYENATKDSVYKLYSADSMKVDAKQFASDIATGQEKNDVGVVENWDRLNPRRDFVDLNQPILSTRSDLSSGSKKVVEPRYPIIDPRAKFDATEKVPSPSPAFGIVEGFDIKTSGLQDSALVTPSGTAVQYLPMPVKWLYVLRDGTLAGADADSHKVPGASKDNPIVGRTAFWTDDESCKLNINTAAEGVFWDTPSVSMQNESGEVNGDKTVAETKYGFSLSASQPAQGEYSRYPGHPATTSLSPVLGWMWNVSPTTSTRPTAAGADYKNFKEAIYTLAPFMPFGKGTSGGNGAYQGATDNPDRVATVNAAGQSIPFKPYVGTKNLYASVDEYLFSRDRVLNNVSGTGGNTGGVGGFRNVSNPALKADLQTALPGAVEKMRFFLTANNRAPELNLFGRPRVTIWPINAVAKLRTTSDDLFAFTSTIGGPVNSASSKAYYFARSDAKSDKVDCPDAPTPNRNRDLIDYLKGLTGSSGTTADIPGFGGSFARKYSAAAGPVTERDQILTEIFDYIRCVNLVDTGTSKGAANSYQPYTPFYGSGIAGYGGITERSYDWSGQVTPIKIGNTKGLGRFITISEAAIMFVGGGTAAAPTMQAILFFEISTPMPGFPGIRETYYTTLVEDTDTGGTRTPPMLKMKVGATEGAPIPLNLGSRVGDKEIIPLINIPNISSHEVMDGRSFMPTLGCGTAFLYFPEHSAPTDPSKNPTDPARNKTATVAVKSFTNTDPNSKKYARNLTVKAYPYVSDVIPIPKATEFHLDRMHFTVKIVTGESADPADPRQVEVQTVNLDFPDVTLPVPTGTDVFSARLSAAVGSKDTGFDFIRATDVVRSLEFVGGKNDTDSLENNQRGDLRLAARQILPNSFYKPRGGLAAYQNKATKILHGLQYGHGNQMTGYTPTTGLSVFAEGGTNRADKPAILPMGITGVKRWDGGPGDYDRGLSKHLDGAFGGKVDEGNVFFAYADGNASRRLPYYAGRNVEEVGQSFFSPNRQLSSAVMFGSLPTGVLGGKPWQTLLFRPDREKSGSPAHPGAKEFPPDHLLLDLFNMPVIEPYAISEPFSTGGKVNLNYIIAPFGYARGDTGKNNGASNDRSYLRRDTALRGVLKSAKIMAVPTTMGDAAHFEAPLSQSGDQYRVRADIDSNLTLEQFEDRFKDTRRGLFRSASEICDMDLYPVADQLPNAVTNWETFWAANAQTGDNMRERPYSHIYPRVTTKSNIYTVHMRCQTIKKSSASDPDVFDEKKDKVLGEYRGSATIERFIDPNDPLLTNYKENQDSVDAFYRFRVVATKQFQPK